MSQKNSSRDIPLTELYSALQFEYLSYFIRAKIYCKNFAENYVKVCEQKKAKIETISSRNNLPSIFNSTEKRDQYLHKFLGETGTPLFTYKDCDIREKMEKWDRFYYFCSGTSISFQNGNEVILGVINFNDKEIQVVNLTDEFGNKHTLHYNNIKRLFPEDFFNF